MSGASVDRSHIREIWRYPVKSMGGERLERAKLTLLGIDYDRNMCSVNETRSTATVLLRGTWPDLLGFHGTLGAGSRRLIDGGKPWTDPFSLPCKKSSTRSSKLIYDESLDRFDVLPLLVATDGAIAAFRRDGRRLRPNIVIGGVDGLAERTWEGGRVAGSGRL